MTNAEQRAFVDDREASWSDGFLDYRRPLSYGRPLPAPAERQPVAGLVPRALEPLMVRTMRRAADIIGAVVALVLLSPLLLAVMIATRLDSNGPVFFRQPRVGRDGAIFTMVKFRTMFTDAEDRLDELESRNEAVGGVLFKMRADPRVTRVGRVLRRCNLDEMPQVLNVLRGDMSIVGPRPLPLRDSQLLATYQPPRYWARLSVRPGITGEWQVRRGRDSDYRHMLDLDMEYLHRRSLRHDAFIAVKTVWILARSIVRR